MALYLSMALLFQIFMCPCSGATLSVYLLASIYGIFSVLLNVGLWCVRQIVKILAWQAEGGTTEMAFGMARVVRLLETLLLERGCFYCSRFRSC